VSASLLQIQWHLLRRGDGNRPEVVNPQMEFPTGEQVRLAVTANQDGYLYIVNQPEGKDGVLLFPDPQVNEGKNFVKKDEQYLVPYRCDDQSDPTDCWMQLDPPAGTENLIVILSRDEITTLPTKPGEVVKAEVTAQLKSASGQRVTKSFGSFTVPGREEIQFATRVKNANTRDNEELITTIQIKHGQ
jgi:hypothetical protein